ncbi:MAG: hypothetical protein K2I52_01185 [Muribaculaceae bacterium]|nr:hypothetical protein [Muribaculaceae bacterium]
MRKIWLIALLTVMFSTVAGFAKSKADNTLIYEIEGAGASTQGNYLVKVTYITKEKKIPDELLKKAAVHGVLFRGFSNPAQRITQKPLAGSAANEAQHIEFYKEFFGEEGNAASFASIVPGSKTVSKSGKEYRVGATITVSKENLLKYLQELGVVKNLNSAF